MPQMFPVCVPAGPKSVLAWVRLAPHANMAHTRRPSQRGLGSAINSLYLFVPQENQGRLYFILLTGFVAYSAGQRTEEAPEARCSAEALDAGQAHRSVCK